MNIYIGQFAIIDVASMKLTIIFSFNLFQNEDLLPH